YMPMWLEVVFRTILFMTALFFITKFLGKKQLSQLSFFEYITGITIGGIAAIVIMDVKYNILIGGMAITVMAAIPYIVDLLSLKSKKFRDFVEGKGSIFIKDGKIMEDNLKKERYTTDELLELLRKKDVFQVSDVEFAVLEPTGDLSVMLKKENQPLTAKSISLEVTPVKEPQTIIMDAEILDEPLTAIGKNRPWLHTELEKRGIAVENVFLGQVNSQEGLTVDLFDDQLRTISFSESSSLLSAMRKCQTDLEQLASATESMGAQQMYIKNSIKLGEAIGKMKAILKG
ncbi:MAG TPA: DUF421 domain-containing protein, partial [Chondromyces sp.]|nr:DUF421 domain-containing protein [Chondromyces sp.]